MKEHSRFIIAIGAAVLLLITLAFIAVSAKNHAEYTKELETGLFNAAWDELIAKERNKEAYPLDAHAFWRIPDSAQPAFMGFVSREARKTQSAIDDAIREYASTLPKDLVGIQYDVELNTNLDAVESLHVVGVFANSPMSRAGVCQHDRIVAINNVPLASLRKGADKKGAGLVIDDLLRAHDGVMLDLKRGMWQNAEVRRLAVKVNGELMPAPTSAEVIARWNAKSSAVHEELAQLFKTADALSRERHTALFGGRETAKKLARATVVLSRSSYDFLEREIFVLDGECVER